MIAFERDGAAVKISVTVTPPHCGPVRYRSSYSCSDEQYAGLLTKLFRDTLWERIRRIRHAAYERGWADAKAKRRKQDYFNGGIDATN